MTPDLHSILRGTDLLSSVPTADLEAVAAGSRVRTFRRGQILFTAGDPGDSVIVVISGRVKAKVLLSQPRGEDGLIWPPVSQEELAHQVGGSRPSVNATLRGFERRGWIQVRGRAVTVMQAAALSRFAGT